MITPPVSGPVGARARLLATTATQDEAPPPPLKHRTRRPAANIAAAITLTIDDAVLVSGIGRTRLYELIAQGAIDCRKCAGRTLIVADSLRDFLMNLPRAKISAGQQKVA